MPQQLLNQLDELKTHFGAREGKKVAGILERLRLRRRKFTNSQELIHYHEILLFLRAYPHTANILRLTERELRNFAERVEALRYLGAELSPLDAPEVSGLAGTAVTDTFSYYIVRWLVKVQPRRLVFDWDWFDDEYRLAETWPRFMPLLEEDAFVEANVPYDKWLSAAMGQSRGPRAGKDVAWLVERFESLPKSDKEKAELYDSLKLYVRWTRTIAGPELECWFRRWRCVPGAIVFTIASRSCKVEMFRCDVHWMPLRRRSGSSRQNRAPRS